MREEQIGQGRGLDRGEGVYKISHILLFEQRHGGGTTQNICGKSVGQSGWIRTWMCVCVCLHAHHMWKLNQ